MKEHCYFVLFCLCLAASICCAWQAVTIRREPRESLVVAPNVRDVGLVRQGKTITAEYELRNVSFWPIDIVDIKHTCSCTSHCISKDCIDPGEIVKLTMSMDTKYRRERIAATSFIQYRRRDRDEKCRPARAQMVADIDPDFETDSTKIIFKKGEPGVREFYLVLRHVDSLKIKELKCSKRCFSAVAINGGDGSKEGVSITYCPDDECPENIGGELTIHTDCVNQPVLCVPLLLEE